MIFNMYIFNRRGDCLFYREWDRKLNTLGDDPSEERRLMFGMLAATNELMRQFSPRKPNEGLQTLKTNTFTLHYLQTLSGLRFILNTDNDAGDLRPSLRHIYANLWVELIVKSPLYDPKSASPVASPLFDQALENYVRSLQCFGVTR